MICCCALAGTRSCELCNRKPEYVHKSDIISIPYTPVNTGEKRLQEIENAIKRLNERIDEILGEEQWDNRQDLNNTQ